MRATSHKMHKTGAGERGEHLHSPASTPTRHPNKLHNARRAVGSRHTKSTRRYHTAVPHVLLHAYTDRTRVAGGGGLCYNTPATGSPGDKQHNKKRNQSRCIPQQRGRSTHRLLLLFPKLLRSPAGLLLGSFSLAVLDHVVETLFVRVHFHVGLNLTYHISHENEKQGQDREPARTGKRLRGWVGERDIHVYRTQSYSSQSVSQSVRQSVSQQRTRELDHGWRGVHVCVRACLRA